MTEPFIWNFIRAIFDASKVAGTFTEVAPAAEHSHLKRHFAFTE